MSQATTIETTRYLHRWGGAKAYCDSLRKDIAEWHRIIEDAYSLEAQSIAAISKTSTPSNPTARKAERCLRITEQYKRYIAGKERQLKSELRFLTVMDEVINELPTNEREVICLYYRDMRGDTWSAVARVLHNSQSNTEKLAGFAIKRISKRIEIEIKLDSF